MNKNLLDDPGADIALVVFSHRTGIPWMRLLRGGFRHCFVLLRQVDGSWTLVDSLPNRIVVRPFDTQAIGRLLPRLARRGDRIVPVAPNRRPARRKRSMRPFSCVELSIRLLGFRSLNVLTTYGLFRSLSFLKENNVDK
jgi:hypothetical protein